MKLFIKIFNSFSNKEKKTFIFVLFFTIIVGFLETLSIGSLIPMVSILVEDTSTDNIHLLNPILKNISPLNFFDTELKTLPPLTSTIDFASDLLIFSKPPVNIID